MNYRAICYYLGVILKVVCAFLVIPAVTAMCYGEWHMLLNFFYTALIFLGVGFLLTVKPPKQKKLGSKEGLLIVGVSWILLSLIGAFPFLFSGCLNYFDAVFETVSGFTTTGATVFDKVEWLPKSLLMWRSLTHWLGGMGVLVFILAIMPTADGSAFQLMKFESPGPQVGKIVSKVRHSAAILYVIYIALTLLELILLLFSGIGFFDSCNLALSTAGTGGFAVTDASIASYQNLYVEIVVTCFMFIFSVNFNIYYLMAIGRFSSILKNEELRIYFIYLVLCILGVALSTLSLFGSFGEALRQASFAVLSCASSSGFVISDFAQWSEVSKGILTVLMIFGACAGSTGGGLKFSRGIVLAKHAHSVLLSSIRPNHIYVIKLNGKPVEKDVAESILGYFLLFCIVIAASIFIMQLLGYDIEVSFYTVLTSFNNIGPNLSTEVGAASSCSSFQWGAKLVMIADMIIGRLEMFPILLLFAPKAWSKRF